MIKILGLLKAYRLARIKKQSWLWKQQFSFDHVIGFIEDIDILSSDWNVCVSQLYDFQVATVVKKLAFNPF